MYKIHFSVFFKALLGSFNRDDLSRKVTGWIMQNNSVCTESRTKIKTAATSLFAILMAVFCIYGLSRGYITLSGRLINPMSMFSVLWFLLLCFVFWFALRNITFRDLVICGISGTVMSLFTCAGAYLLSLGTISLGDPMLYINILALSLVFAALLRIAFISAPKIKEWLYKFDSSKILSGRLERTDAATYFIFLGIILLFWLVAFIALFPGYLSYKAPLQLNEFLSGENLSAQYPLLHTLLISLFVKIGSLLFSSNTAGLAIYCAFQAVAVGAVLAYLILFMIRIRVPKAVIIFSALFLSINPIIQIFVFTPVSDVLFGALFLLLLLFTADMIINPEWFFRHPWHMIRYSLIIILTSLMCNYGIFIIIISVPFLLWAGRKHLLKAAGTFLAGLAVAVCITGPIYNAAGAPPFESADILSVPIQQIMRVINTDSESVSEEQKAAISKYIPEESWSEYDQNICDPVKEHFNNDQFAAEPMEFITLWIQLGMEHPGIYIDAFAHLTSPYWYPGLEASQSQSAAADFYSPDSFRMEQSSLLPSYYNYLMDVGQGLLKGAPVLSAAVCIAAPVWGVLLCCTVLFRQKKYNLLIPLIMMISFIFTLLLRPAADIRYIFPMLIACPLLVTLPFIDTERKEPSKRFMEIFRFAVNGIFCFIIDWGTMMLLMKLTHLPDWVCIAAGFILSVIVNYIICVVWVFKDAGRQTVASQVIFIGSSVIGLVLTELFMLIFIKFMPVTIAKVIVALIVMVWNYTAKRFAIYRINPKLQNKV